MDKKIADLIINTLNVWGLEVDGMEQEIEILVNEILLTFNT